MSTKTIALLTSGEVVELTGLSYRRLDYWTTSGKISAAVPAEGSGSARRYAPEVLVEIEEILDAVAKCPFGHGERPGR